jgi:hypothetical protein
MTDINDKSRAELEQQIAELQAVHAFLPSADIVEALERRKTQIAALNDDPLLIEARETLAAYEDGRGFHEYAEQVRDGEYDGCSAMGLALAALRRGTELASAPAELVKSGIFVRVPGGSEWRGYATTLRTHQEIGTFRKYPNLEAAIEAILASLTAAITRISADGE